MNVENKKVALFSRGLSTLDTPRVFEKKPSNSECNSNRGNILTRKENKVFDKFS